MRDVLAIAVIWSAALYASAQEPQPKSVNLRTTSIASPATTTPEMWLYQQEQSRHDDPQQAVRRKAELRAAERQSRIASMKWYGLSNSRPLATPTPWFGSYVPAWSSNSLDPMRWRCQGAVRVAEQPRSAY